MKTYRQLLGRGLRRSLALVCVLIILGFAAIEGLHSHAVVPNSQTAQETPCWVCHIGHSASPKPHVVLTSQSQICFKLAPRILFQSPTFYDGSPYSIRPPPVL